LQIIQIWFYIRELQTEFGKGTVMAEELDRNPPDDKITLISEIADELTAQQLTQVRQMIEEKRREKIDEAKEQVIARMREELAELDLDFDEVMGTRQRRRRRDVPLPPKYRSPDGKEWSGRGYAPAWIREYEEAGGDREDYNLS
jgi:DNA-binding protein H-NS